MTALDVTQRPSSRDGDRARLLEVGHLGELCALLPLGDGADGVERRRRRARAPLATMASVMERVSLTGRVLGMTQTWANPPAAAAARPLAMSSLYSWPGSRRWAWRSTKAGKRRRPRPSTTRARSAPRISSVAAPAPTRVTIPPSITTSTTASSERPGSTARTEVITRISGCLGRVAIGGACLASGAGEVEGGGLAHRAQTLTPRPFLLNLALRAQTSPPRPPSPSLARKARLRSGEGGARRRERTTSPSPPRPTPSSPEGRGRGRLGRGGLGGEVCAVARAQALDAGLPLRAELGAGGGGIAGVAQPGQPPGERDVAREAGRRERRADGALRARRDRRSRGPRSRRATLGSGAPLMLL